MVTISELNGLQKQKEMLLAKSDLYRATFHLECERVRSKLDWVDRGVALARTALPLIAVAAPICGLWLARRRRSRSKRTVASRLAAAWRLGQILMPLARAFASLKPARKPHAPKG